MANTSNDDSKTDQKNKHEAEKPKSDKVEITKEVEKPAKEKYPDFGFGEQSF